MFNASSLLKRVLVISIFLLNVAGHAVHSNWSFFTKYQFHWDERMIGISLGVIGLLVGLVQGGLIRWVNPKLGNEKSIYIGMALYTIGMALFATATQSWMLFVFLVPYCLGGIAGPAMQSVISGSVPANAQGEMQGLVSSLMSASAIVGPPLMSNTFYYFTHNNAPFKFAGAPFVLGAVLMLVSTFISFVSFRKK